MTLRYGGVDRANGTRGRRHADFRDWHEWLFYEHERELSACCVYAEMPLRGFRQRGWPCLPMQQHLNRNYGMAAPCYCTSVNKESENLAQHRRQHWMTYIRTRLERSAWEKERRGNDARAAGGRAKRPEGSSDVGPKGWPVLDLSQSPVRVLGHELRFDEIGRLPTTEAKEDVEMRGVGPVDPQCPEDTKSRGGRLAGRHVPVG